MKQILINCGELENRVAIVDFFIERRGNDHLAGSIFKGRINNLEPSLQAAFVEIGAPKNAFLHYWDMMPATRDLGEVEGDDDDLDDEPESDEHDDDDDDADDADGEEVVTDVKSMRQRFLGLLMSLRPAPTVATPAPAPATERPRRRRQQQRPRPRPKAARKPECSVEEIPALFPQRSELLVQVTKGPIGTKGARVTTHLSIPGRYLVLLPNSSHVGVSKRIDDRKERTRLRQILRRLKLPANMGVICRTVGSDKTEEDFKADLEMLLRTWATVQERSRKYSAPCCVYEEPDLVHRTIRDLLTEDIDEIVSDSTETCEFATDLVRRYSRQDRVRIREHRRADLIFDRYGVSKQIESIFQRRVQLPSGGYICIDETEALIAIDVNSGKYRSGKDHPETIINTNLEAATEVARQLRLRNIGGLIIVDFIDMRSKKDQLQVSKHFKEMLEHDKARTKILPISAFGLVEMTRQREEESLQDTIFGTCPYCKGKGLVKSATSVSVELQRRLRELMRRKRRKLNVRVTVHPDVLQRLKTQDAKLLDAIEAEYGGQLTFRADEDMHMEDFRLADVETGEDL